MRDASPFGCVSFMARVFIKTFSLVIELLESLRCWCIWAFSLLDAMSISGKQNALDKSLMQVFAGCAGGASSLSVPCLSLVSASSTQLLPEALRLKCTCILLKFFVVPFP